VSPEELKGRIRRALEGRSDVHLALLFGSAARGTARPDSDVDIAVDAPSADLFDLAATLVGALDLEVDLVSLEDPSIPLLEELIRDGIKLHEAWPGAFAGWRSRALTTLETDRPWYARMREAWLKRVAERGFSGG
jgi:predicted nucleotidyltransferase